MLIMKIKIKDHQGALYAPVIPDRAEMVGEITRPGRGGIGALVLLADGLFVQANAGVIYQLDQRDVYSEIVKALRHEAKQTQAEFANEHRVSLSSVAQWESGRRTPGFAQIRLLLIEAKAKN